MAFLAPEVTLLVLAGAAGVVARYFFPAWVYLWVRAAALGYYHARRAVEREGDEWRRHETRK